MIYTIGHSNYTVEKFLELLKRYQITAICDVRSAPYSQYCPHFNREAIKESFASHNIEYVYLGDELGARSQDTSCIKNGIVYFDLLAQTPLFMSGINRVIKGSKSFKIALMCAEKNPQECHRTILISKALEERAQNITHILEDGFITHTDLIEQLTKDFNQGQIDSLLMNKIQMRKQTYQMQAHKMGYAMTI